jgi:hypothetical protein
MRILREYERVAQETHFCDRCCEYIEPGDVYSGSIMIRPKSAGRKGSYLIVVKVHVEPLCEEPPDPEEEEWLEDDLGIHDDAHVVSGDDTPLSVAA